VRSGEDVGKPIHARTGGDDGFGDFDQKMGVGRGVWQQDVGANHIHRELRDVRALEDIVHSRTSGPVAGDVTGIGPRHGQDEPAMGGDGILPLGRLSQILGGQVPEPE